MTHTMPLSTHNHKTLLLLMQLLLLTVVFLYQKNGIARPLAQTNVTGGGGGGGHISW